MQKDGAFIVQHEYEGEDEFEYVKLIGIYTTEEKAKAVVERLKKLPGFDQYPDGFHVNFHTFNRVNWTTGFIRVWPDGETMS